MKPGAKVARTASHSAHNGMCLWRVALAKSRPLSDLHRNGTAPKSEGFTLSSLLPPWPWTKPSRQSIQIFSSVALKLSLPRLQHLLVATPASVGGSTLVIVALCTRYSITPLRCFVGRLGSRRMALSVLAHKDLAASGKDCQAAEDCSRKRLQAVQLRHRGFRCQLAARQQLMPGETTSKKLPRTHISHHARCNSFCRSDTRLVRHHPSIGKASLFLRAEFHDAGTLQADLHPCYKGKSGK